MGIFGNGRRAPAHISKLVPAGERLLAWGSGPPRTDGEPTVVVATDKSLIAPGYIGPISWTDLARAEWSDTLLELVTMQALQGAEPPVRINLDEPGSVPQVVWERIESRIILQRHVELVGKKGARIIAKRSDLADSPPIESLGLTGRAGADGQVDSADQTGSGGGDGVGPAIAPVDWLVVYDAGIDPADPQLRARVDKALAEIKASAGI